MIVKIFPMDPLGKSDHIVIEFNFLCESSFSKPHYIHYFYDKGDYQSNAELLDIDWKEAFDGLDNRFNLCGIFFILTIFTWGIYVSSVISLDKDTTHPPWLSYEVLKV